MKTRRRLNYKLIAVIVVTAVVLGGGVHVLHGVQVKRNAATLLKQADQAEKDGDLSRAEDSIDRYLTLRPNDVEGLARYAAILEKRASSDEGRLRAVKVYERVIRLDGGRADLRRKLAEMMVSLGQYRSAETHIDALLEDSRDDGRLNYLKARCEEARSHFVNDKPQPDESERSGALAHYQYARSNDPTIIDAYTRAAELLRTRLNDANGADAMMDAGPQPSGKEGLITQNPRSAAAYLARARYRQRYMVPGVDLTADIAQALQFAPDDPEVILTAAAQAASQGKPAEARKLLEGGVGRHPANPTLCEALATVLLNTGDAEGAVACVKAGLGAQRAGDRLARLGLQLVLADILVAADRRDAAWLDEAAKLVAELRQERGVRLPTELLDDLDARALYVRGNWAAAAPALEQSGRALAASPALKRQTKRSLMLLARCYERLGNPDQQYEAYRRAVAIDFAEDPYWVEARLGLASALASLNRIDEAIVQCRLVLPRSAAAGLVLARLQIAQNLRRPPAERRWDDVEATLRQFESRAGTAASQSAAEVALLRAEALAAQDNLDATRQGLRQALKREPKDVSLWLALAGVASRSGKPEEALEVLDEADRALGDRVELKVARAGYWATQRGDKAAAALADLERGGESLPKADRARLDRSLAAAYTAIGRNDRAGELWKQLDELVPNNLGVQFSLFEQALAADKDDEARRILEQKIEPTEGKGGPVGSFARGLLLVNQWRRSPGDHDLAVRARASFLEAAARRPSWSRVPAALGGLEEMRQNVTEAIDHYERAVVALGDRTPSLVERLLQLLASQRSFDKAAQVVHRLQEERIALSPRLRELAARVELQAGEAGRALEILQGSVSEQSKDPAQLILLARVRAANKQDAEALFRRAIEVAPADPEARLWLILYLKEQGKTEKAEAALKEAEAALPRDKAEVALAEAHLALGHVAEAEALLRKALEARPDDLTVLKAASQFYLTRKRIPEAVPLLERLGQAGGDSADAAWARQTHALLVASLGNRSAETKANAILGEGGRPVAELSTGDLRTRAMVLALQPTRAKRREAIKMLEGLLQRPDAQPSDVARLAELCESDGDWPKAQSYYRKAVTDQPKDPRSLAALALALLRHDRADEAAVYAGRLEEVAADQPITYNVRARLLIAQKKTPEAVALITGYAQADDRRLAAAAVLLEQVGQAAAAEPLYRRLAERSVTGEPGARLALAGFLGRQGRTAEALDVIDAVRANCPADLVSAASLKALYGARSRDTALADRVAAWFAELVKKAPDQVGPAFALANVQILQGRYDEAEAAFRDLHRREPKTGAPLNNLAWLLALREGRGAEALKLVQQAIDLEGDTPDLLDTRALAYLATGKSDAAITDLENAVAVTPGPDKYFHLALAYRDKDRKDDAAASLRKGQQMGLSAESLNPLERSSYARLVEALPQR
jgi:tetratricopeptide (TPR) repeat protein